MPRRISSAKYPGDSYQHFLNCPDSAFQLALRALDSRVARSGERAAPTVEWVRAQRMVFANCDSETPSIPAELPAAADPADRADRAYQIAAAAFYATRYDDAARLFRAIAADAQSPWRMYGRYLAARSLIRSATLPENVAPEQQARRDRLLAEAETELNAVVGDRAAAPIHAWARQLLDYVGLRIHPIDHLHLLGRRLANTATIRAEDLDDYRWAMDQQVGNTIDYLYPDETSRGPLVANDDLTDWIVTMQGSGDTAAAEHAVARWQATQTMPWLVAALWRVAADADAAPAVLDAAAAVDRASPAYLTVSALRVRRLARADLA